MLPGFPDIFIFELLINNSQSTRTHYQLHTSRHNTTEKGDRSHPGIHPGAHSLYLHHPFCNMSLMQTCILEEAPISWHEHTTFPSRRCCIIPGCWAMVLTLQNAPQPGPCLLNGFFEGPGGREGLLLWWEPLSLDQDCLLCVDCLWDPGEGPYGTSQPWWAWWMHTQKWNASPAPQWKRECAQIW